MQNKNKTVEYIHLGLIDYKEAWNLQTEYFKKIIDIKISNRDKSESVATPNYIFVCEHQHVYTLGKSGKAQNLLVSEQLLKEKGATFYEINRGGDITYHGPGQLIVYPVLDLDNFFTDIHKYMRLLEEAVILTIKDFGIDAGRITGLTGVWVDCEKEGKARKICAFGVKTSRWVSMHGLGFNVNTDLTYFDYIVPCGISDKSVTSLEKELGRKMNMPEVERSLVKNLAQLFEMNVVGF